MSRVPAADRACSRAGAARLAELITRFHAQAPRAQRFPSRPQLDIARPPRFPPRLHLDIARPPRRPPRPLPFPARAAGVTGAAPVVTAAPLPELSYVRVAMWFALFEAHGYHAGTTRADERTASPLDVTARVSAAAARLPRAVARPLTTIPAVSAEDPRRDVYDAA